MKNNNEIQYILNNCSDNDVFIVRSKVRLGLQSLILAPLIRLFTKSKYNHAGLISFAFMDSPVVVEADEKGFRPSCYFKDWLKKQDNFIIYTRTLPKISCDATLSDMKEEIRKNCFKRMVDILYKPYDFASTLFYQVVHLLTKRKAWIGDESARHVNCSEAVAYVHGERDYYKFLPVDFEKSPRYEVVFKVEKGKIIYSKYSK